MKDPLPPQRKIVIGHKNPDTDSIAAAVALTYLKKQQGQTTISAACAGIPAERTAYIFDFFNVSLPEIVPDVTPTVKDIMNHNPVSAQKDMPLLQGAQLMQENHSGRLPVTDKNGTYLGMLSLFDLTQRFFQRSSNFDLEGNGTGLFGRQVRTSIALTATALHATICSPATDPEKIKKINVFVGAMDRSTAKEHLQKADATSIALVIGSRLKMQKIAVESGIAMLIITNQQAVTPEIIDLAKKYNVAVLQTPFDSATAIRRLKFSSPVQLLLQKDVITFSSNDRLRDIRYIIRQSREDIFPVVDKNKKLIGTLSKLRLESEPPTSLILVDHNEMSQAVHGAEELPIIEIVDHHRISFGPTSKPITITCDSVGSTCTLITEMFQQSAITPPKEIAGILLGGVVTDTLMLRSPTSTKRDRVVISYLEKLAGIDGGTLLKNTLDVGSVISSMKAEDVLCADQKNYSTETCRMSISQIEENGFENFNSKKDELFEELVKNLDKHNRDIACLLVTDVIAENSLLLVAGNKHLLHAIHYVQIETNLFNLPRILSRKKQLLPDLLKAFE